MVVAGLLTADQRLGFQIHQWMKELADTIQLETHSDLRAFTEKIETEVFNKEKTEGAEDETVLDVDDLGSGKSSKASAEFYRLLIVDVDLLLQAEQRPLSWATAIKTLLHERKRSDPIFPTKILFLSFESGTIHPESFRHEAVDDLILKPLDRSLFLQKIELLTAEKQGVKPSFLFRQATEMAIEVGKDVMIDEISEFAVAIRNPAPLAEGVFAAIHCEVFGSRGEGRMIARSYKSEKHPTIEGEYLVRFGFFGITAAQLANVKKYIRTYQMPSKVRAAAARTKQLDNEDPPVPFNRVAIIDMDEDSVNDIRSTLKDHYVGVAVTQYASYSRFLVALNKLIPSSTKSVMSAAGAPPQPGEPTFIGPVQPVAGPAKVEKLKIPGWSGKAPLVFLMNGLTPELIRFVSGGGQAQDRIFGKTQTEWMDRPGDWLGGMDKQDAKDFEQLMDYVRGGGRGRAFIRVRDDDERTYFLEASGVLEKSGEADGLPIMKIELKELEESEWTKAASQGALDAEVLDPSELRFDAIFVDGNLIRGEIPVWIEGLTELFVKAGVIQSGDPFPKVVIMADERSRLKAEQYRFKSIGDFVYKPLDRNFMSHKAKTLVPELVPRGEPNFPPFVHCEVPAKLAKGAKMEEVSEYGLTIAHPSPFRESVYMRFFSSLFGESGAGVIGRCTHCDKKQGEGEGYACHFTFFGAPDEVLKRIRTWIREDYVHKKEAN